MSEKRAGTDRAKTWMYSYPIHEGTQICVYHPDAYATVRQLFYVEVRLMGEEHVASSNISNSFEMGETSMQAIKNYLGLLVDKLAWYQKHQAELSPSISHDFRFLQDYLRIV